MKSQDRIYSKCLKKISPFVFDKRVASVFDDMISRSVPGYSDIVQMSGILAAHFVRPKTRVYDLGCSLGAVSQVILQSVPVQPYELIAIDSSQAMIHRAKKILKAPAHVKLQLLCTKVEEVPIHRASMVLLNFVLQFIAPKNRPVILKKIYQGMNHGGVLVLSEKINFDSKKESEVQRLLHEEFKKSKGYSELEISQKRTALEKVLIPESLQTHQRRLRQAGFKEIYVWFRCFNFVSIIALKGN